MATYWVRTAALQAGVSLSGSLATWSNDPVLKEQGAAATTLPGATDDVIVAVASGSLNINQASFTWGSLTFEEGWAGTVNWNANPFSIAGSLRFSASGTWAGTQGAINLSGTGVHTIRSAGRVHARTFTINSSGSYTLEDAFNTSVNLNVNCTTGGSFNSAGFNITCNTFNSTVAGTRTIDLGTSTVTMTAANTTPFNTSGAGLTLNAASASLVFTGGNAAIQTSGLSATAVIGSITCNSSGAFTVTTSITCTNFTRLGGGAGSSLTLNFITLTVTGTLRLDGWASGSIRSPLAVQSYSYGTVITVQLGSTGAVSLGSNGVNIRDVAFAGTNTPVTGPWVGDAFAAYSSTTTMVQTHDGITFSPKRTLYKLPTGQWEANYGWSLSSGGAQLGGMIPLAHDDVVIDSNSGTSVSFYAAHGWLCFNLTINAPQLTNFPFVTSGINRWIYGSFDWVAGAIQTANNAGLNLYGRNVVGPKRFFFDTHGKEYPGHVNIWTAYSGGYDVRPGTVWGNMQVDGNSAGGPIVLQDGFVLGGLLTHSSGILTFASGGTVSLGKFISETTNTRTINLAGCRLRLTGSGAVWQVVNNSASRTINHDSGTVFELTDTSMANKIFNAITGQSLASSTLIHDVDGPGSTVTLNGYLGTVRIYGPGKRVLLASGGFQGKDFDLQGTAQNPAYLGSNTLNVQRPLVGTARRLRYVQVQDVTVPTATTVYDGTNVGNNGPGWTFAAGPPPWTPPVPPIDYYAGIRPYYTRIQEDGPLWYIGANTANPTTYNDRGPNDRAVTATSGQIEYDPPLIREGRSMRFSGDDRSGLGYLAADAPTVFTAEFWYKGSYSGTATRGFLARDNSSSVKAWNLGIDTTGRAYITWVTLSGTYVPPVTSNKVIGDNQPHHLAVIFDGSTATASIYIDGVLDVSVKAGVYQPLATPTFEIGANRGTNTLIGSMDEIAFYGKALTPEQILAHYNDGKGLFGRVKVWDGAAWVRKPLKVWNGAAWVERPVKVFRNDTWAPVP